MKLLPIVALVSLLISPAIASDTSRLTQKPEREVKHIKLDLDQNRLLILKGPVLDINIDDLNDSFKEYASKSNKPIYLVIDSPGGSVDAGMRLINTIKAAHEKLSIDTICIVENRAFSMAAVISTFCTRTYMLPTASLLYHEASYGAKGPATQMLSYAIYEYNYAMTLNNMIADALHMPHKLYYDLMLKEWWIMAESAVAYGIVDGIVDSIYYTAKPPETDILDIIFSQGQTVLWMEHDSKQLTCKDLIP